VSRQPGSWLTWDVGQMSTYRTTRFVIGLIGLAAIIAVAKYLDVKSRVEGSPYWATLSTEAHALGTFVDEAEVERSSVASDSSEPLLLAVWSEHSHSFVRTGPFSATVVVNREQTVRAFSDVALLKHCLKDGWRLEVDGSRQEPVLSSGGATFGGFRAEIEGDHTIKVIADSGKCITWSVRFRNKQPNQALQHNDPSCHVSCLRTPRASRGRG
jgi:hypothetical protein